MWKHSVFRCENIKSSLVHVNFKWKEKTGKFYVRGLSYLWDVIRGRKFILKTQRISVKNFISQQSIHLSIYVHIYLILFVSTYFTHSLTHLSISMSVCFILVASEHDSSLNFSLNYIICKDRYYFCFINGILLIYQRNNDLTKITNRLTNTETSVDFAYELEITPYVSWTFYL